MPFITLGTPSHDTIPGVSADDHHTEAHNLVDHAARAHAALTDIGVSDHHVLYTDAEAIAAVEGEATLNLAGAVDVATGQVFSADGLLFPDTQISSADANLLDDYEEGTWTPGVSFGGGVVGITFSIQSGRYVKVGSLVHVYGKFSLISKGSSNGDAIITGLPFTPLNVSGLDGGAAGRFDVISFANQFMMSFITNDATIRLTELTEAGGVTTLTDGNFGDTAQIRFSVSYRTA